MDTERRKSMKQSAGRQAILLGVAGVLSFAAIQLVTGAIGPRLEGRLFPVVENVEVQQIEESPCGDCISITGTFEKVRECVFLDLLVVYRTPTGGEVGVPVRFTEGTMYRGEGVHEYGPWEVDLSARQFEESTVVEAFHQCHPFWVAVTRFHPPL